MKTESLRFLFLFSVHTRCLFFLCFVFLFHVSSNSLCLFLFHKLLNSEHLLNLFNICTVHCLRRDPPARIHRQDHDQIGVSGIFVFHTNQTKSMNRRANVPFLLRQLLPSICVRNHKNLGVGTKAVLDALLRRQRVLDRSHNNIPSGDAEDGRDVFCVEKPRLGVDLFENCVMIKKCVVFKSVALFFWHVHRLHHEVFDGGDRCLARARVEARLFAAPRHTLVIELNAVLLAVDGPALAAVQLENFGNIFWETFRSNSWWWRRSDDDLLGLLFRFFSNHVCLCVLFIFTLLTTRRHGVSVGAVLQEALLQ
eukprot:PhM_4_TR1046/c0_g1_i1/m.50463